MEDSTRNHFSRAHTPPDGVDSLFRLSPSSSQQHSMDDHRYYPSSHTSGGGIRIPSPHSESSSSFSPRPNPMGIDRLTHRSVSPPLRASPSVNGGDDSPRLLQPTIYSTSQSPISAAQMPHYEQQRGSRYMHGSSSSYKLPPLADIRQNTTQVDDVSTASTLMSLSNSGHGNNQRSPSTSLKPKLLPLSPPSLPHHLYSPGGGSISSGSGHLRHGTDEAGRLLGHNNSASMTVTAARSSSSGGRSESAMLSNVDDASPSSTNAAYAHVSASNPSTPIITVTSATPNAQQSPSSSPSPSSPSASRKRARSVDSDLDPAAVSATGANNAELIGDEERAVKEAKAAPGCWRNANGFRRNMTSTKMVSLDAPTRPKKAAYNSKKQSKSSKKDSRASADKYSASAMSPGSEDVKLEQDELEEADEQGEGEQNADEELSPEDAALAGKRRKNAVAARQSRQRKLEALKRLEDENNELKLARNELEASIEAWKAKAEHLKNERDEAVGKLAVSKHWVKTHLNVEQVNNFDMHCA